jgi:hypothetical protein
MQVNVFITRVEGQLQNKLLVLPMSPQSAIPPQYRVGWVYYARVDTRDRMFGDLDAVTLEAQIAAQGFAIVTPETPDRR